jgi:hypothetical protein
MSGERAIENNKINVTTENTDLVIWGKNFFNCRSEIYSNSISNG